MHRDSGSLGTNTLITHTHGTQSWERVCVSTVSKHSSLQQTRVLSTPSLSPVSLSLSFYPRALLFLSKRLCLTANLSLFISARMCSAGIRRLHIWGYLCVLQHCRKVHRCCRSLIHCKGVALSNWKFNLCSGAEICHSQQLSFVFINSHTHSVAHTHLCSHEGQ